MPKTTLYFFRPLSQQISPLFTAPIAPIRFEGRCLFFIFRHFASGGFRNDRLEPDRPQLHDPAVAGDRKAAGTITVNTVGGESGVVVPIGAYQTLPLEVTHVTAATATPLVALW